MRLKLAHIKNFRSIKDVTIRFEPACRVLVGINESGKSNILRALALFDDDALVKNDDVREITPEEDPDQEAFVRFVFSLDKHDKVAALRDLESRVLGSSADPLIDVAG